MAASHSEVCAVNAKTARAVMLAKTAIRRAQIVELHGRGVKTARIAKEMGVDVRTVQRGLIVAGARQPSRRPTEDDKLRAKEMLVDGASYEEVSRTIGFGARYIQTWHPGYKWTMTQVIEARSLARQMEKVERRTRNGLL